MRNVIVLFSLLLLPLLLSAAPADIAKAENKAIDTKAETCVETVPLVISAKKGDLAKVSDLLKKGADVNVKDDSGDTALLVASGQGYRDMVKLLIKNGADVNARNNEGESGLLWAVYKGYNDIADLLIKNGANVNDKEKLGVTLVNWTVLANNKKGLDLLIKNGADVNILSNWGFPLDSAYFCGVYFFGNIELMKLLVEAGANVDIRNENGATLLMRAVNDGNKEVVEFLIKNGADVNAKDNIGLTPLLLAAYHKYRVIEQLLIKNGADIKARLVSGKDINDIAEYSFSTFAKTNPVAMELAKGDMKAINNMLNSKNISAEDRSLALCLSSEFGYKNIVKRLLKEGVDANSSSSNCGMPVDGAISNGHKDIVKLLIKNGANIKDGYRNRTILVEAKNKEMADLLIRNGADVNGRDILGSVLEQFVDFSTPEMVEFLIEKGANVNIISAGGRTPLMSAISSKRADMASLLIKKGAYVDEVNSDELAALMDASKDDYPDTVKYPVEADFAKYEGD